MGESKPYLPTQGKRRFLATRKLHLHTLPMVKGAWEKIREARTRAGLTQAQVADACGISREAVSQWEARDEDKRTYPGRANLLRFAQLTGSSIGWLMGESNEASQETLESQPHTPAESYIGFAHSLLQQATPRTRDHLDAIISAAEQGKLTDEDVELLGAIARRLER